MAGRAKKTAPAPQKEAERGQKISIEKLRRSCGELFGVSRSTFDGATAGLAEKKYSVKEMEKIINDFLSQEVK